MATLSSAGVGSGLDVNGIVSQLMALEQRPLEVLAKQQSSYKAQISAVGQVQASVSAFKTAAEGLTSASAAPAYKTSSSDGTVLTASASSTAVAGNYSLAVTQIAQSQKIVAGGVVSKTAAIGDGTATTVTIDFGTISGGTYNAGTGQYSGASFTANASKSAITVNLDGTNNTLEGIRDAINAKGASVTASIVNDGSGTPYRLVLTSTDTGVANSLRIGVAGNADLQNLLAYDPAGTQNFSQTQAAQNAAFSVDGIGITSASNTVGDAIQGVTLNLLKAGNSTLAITRDSAALSNAINTLVTAYNNLDKAVNTLTAKDATLQGDNTLLGIQRQIRSAIGAVATTTGIYDSLASVDVNFQKDGTLKLDSSKLADKLTSKYADVIEVVNAIAVSLGTVNENILKTGTGQITNKVSSLNDAIAANTKQQDLLNARLASVEARYRAQFQALDTMMVTMNQTSSFLTQQFYRDTGNNNS